MDYCDLDEKLWDFLSGDASEQLCTEIEQWRKDSAEHEVYFIAFRKDYLKMRWALRCKLIERDHFGEIQQHIFCRMRWIRSLRIAATVVVFLGCGMLVWWSLPEERQEVTLADRAEIQPGKAKATLILSSGSEIPIAAMNTELEERDGTTIKVDDRGEISYRSDQCILAEKEVFNRIVIPRGGEFAMLLSDGTRVWLNSATELKYPVKFVGDTRTVFLKGEAYFEVKPDVKRVFIVRTDREVEVKVYGTEFNVNTYKPGTVETVLVKGSVGIQNGDQAIKLVPGEKADYVQGKAEIKVEAVDVAPYIAWKEGNFIFQSEPLEEIMNKLSLWYDVEVFYANNELRNICLSGDMKRYKEIGDLLYYFEKSSNVKFRIQDRTIIVEQQ